MQARAPIRFQQNVLADQDRGQQVAGCTSAKATAGRRLESGDRLGVRDEKWIANRKATSAIS
jgi:hypothetical protein